MQDGRAARHNGSNGVGTADRHTDRGVGRQRRRGSSHRNCGADSDIPEEIDRAVIVDNDGRQGSRTDDPALSPQHSCALLHMAHVYPALP
jgi:hypothetical protein